MNKEYMEKLIQNVLDIKLKDGSNERVTVDTYDEDFLYCTEFSGFRNPVVIRISNIDFIGCDY